MSNKQRGALVDTAPGPTLAQQQSLFEALKMLELAGDLIDQALGDAMGLAISEEDCQRLVSVKRKIRHAVSLVMDELTRRNRRTPQ